jgi:hypothetical protein
VYALVSFLDFFLVVALEFVELIVIELFASGESRSKLGPAEGVLEPVLDGDCIGESFIGDATGSVGEATRDFSCPVTASEIALRPK